MHGTGVHVVVPVVTRTCDDVASSLVQSMGLSIQSAFADECQLTTGKCYLEQVNCKLNRPIIHRLYTETARLSVR